MWIVAGIVVVVVVALVAIVLFVPRRAARARRPKAPIAEPPAGVHALDEALRTVESLTDAKGSSLLDQADSSGRTIRDRIASGEARLDSLRTPDDTDPLLRRVLDEVAPGDTPADPATPPATGV